MHLSAKFFIYHYQIFLISMFFSRINKYFFWFKHGDCILYFFQNFTKFFKFHFTCLFRNIYAISVTIIGWYCDPQKSNKLLEMEASSSTPPVDRHKIVYIIFVWLGVGTLLPWNFFITQTSYWNYRYRDLTCQVSYKRKFASSKYILNKLWSNPSDFHHAIFVGLESKYR